jgi:N-acyl-D-aspartate/D-glutamate deacylase
MIASDAMPLVRDGRPFDEATWPPPPRTVTHPRTGGTFAKVLRRYVREDGALDLVEAIRRCSTLPALTLQSMSPDMLRKGRLSRGSDADVVAFDPRAVSETATFADSCRPSTGFRHVLVNGTVLIRDGEVDAAARPGRPIRAG